MSAQLGKYRLLKKLAAGGMGEIWLARQQGLAGFDRLAVVKKILEHLSESKKFVEMFLDEARLASQLSHPHIVQIYDLGKTSETYYIAMEYVHGENLRVVNRAASRTPEASMPPHLVARVISQACEALHYAHTRTDETGHPFGIVHRDVSPQNLLLSYEGQIKVVDFGIAKAVGRMTQTKTGDLKGKTVYMSPEQIRGGVIDPRTDVFAMGIVLWELATGTRLYNQESDFLVMQAICEEPPPSPMRVRGSVSPELEEIILTALAKKPDDRYQSANDMHIALERYLQNSSRIVSSTDLASYMRGLFPDRVERFTQLEDAEKTPDSGLLAGMSALFEEPVSSAEAAPRRTERHTLPLPAEKSAEERTKARAVPPLEPDPRLEDQERRSPRGTKRPAPEAPPPRPAPGAPRSKPAPEAPRPKPAAVRVRPPPAPIPEAEPDDDIDLSQVVDPYADEEAPAPPEPRQPRQQRIEAPEDVAGASHGEEARPWQKKRRRRLLAPLLVMVAAPFVAGRRAVARAWYALPGRGRLTTGTARLLRIVFLLALLAATAWGFDWTIRTVIPPLDGGMTNHLVALVRERLQPPPMTILRISSTPSAATVVLDGEVAGITPFRDRVPRSGAIEVELRSPGYAVWRRRVSPSQELVEVEAVLVRP